MRYLKYFTIKESWYDNRNLSIDYYLSYDKKEWDIFKNEVEYICQELRDDFDKYDFKAEFRDITPGLGGTQDCGKIEIIGNVSPNLTIVHGEMSDMDEENLLKTLISESDKDRWVRVVSESDTFKTVCDRMQDLEFFYRRGWISGPVMFKGMRIIFEFAKLGVIVKTKDQKYKLLT